MAVFPSFCQGDPSNSITMKHVFSIYKCDALSRLCCHGCLLHNQSTGQDFCVWKQNFSNISQTYFFKQSLKICSTYVTCEALSRSQDKRINFVLHKNKSPGTQSKMKWVCRSGVWWQVTTAFSKHCTHKGSGVYYSPLPSVMLEHTQRQTDSLARKQTHTHTKL